MGSTSRNTTIRWWNLCRLQSKRPVFNFCLGTGSYAGKHFFSGSNCSQKLEKVLAQCTDEEWKSILGAVGPKGGVRMTWAFQLLCEFEMDGKRYRVAPGYWSTFISEDRLPKFLDKAISPDGRCQLWVNPENHLKAELVANDIKDFLLH